MNRIARFLCSRIIDANGTTTVLIRAASGQVLDKYGEPPNGIWTLNSFPITIAVNTDRRVDEQTEIGGLPDPKKEYLYFYVNGTYDIRTGDEIVYPAGSGNQWLIFFVEPVNVRGTAAITECKAHRDSRY